MATLSEQLLAPLHLTHVDHGCLHYAAVHGTPACALFVLTAVHHAKFACSMRKDAEEKKLPPIYRGKWASASKAEVDEMIAKGVPYCYRFRVPKVGKSAVIRG